MMQLNIFKSYPNFSYVIVDLTTNEFDNRKYEFNIEDHKTGKYNGYGFATMKQGFTNAGEISNGTLVRRVQLPQSYLKESYWFGVKWCYIIMNLPRAYLFKASTVKPLKY